MLITEKILKGEKDNDLVHSILSGTPFKLRSDEEKLIILKKGRPLYNINTVKRDTTGNSDRSFHPSWYEIHKWLCGSEIYNKLFCWPCLLMRPETSSWCSIGNDDMKRFTTLAVKHSRCKSHIKAICEFDEALTNFGLPLEFINELKFKCKEEEEVEEEEEEDDSMSDKTEADGDFENLYCQEENRKEEVIKTKRSCTGKPTTRHLKENKDVTKIFSNSSKITFKTWQELCKNNFPISKSKFLEDYCLYKWKRKIAKQELKNAQLLGEKLKFEIEVLRAKMEYYKALKQDSGTKDEPSVTSATEVLDNQ